MNKFPAEKYLAAFVAYAKAYLPTILTAANVGETIQAPAFSKIVKGTQINLQYLPYAIITLEDGAVEEAGPGYIRPAINVLIIVAASNPNPDTLDAYLDRYVSTLCDLAASEYTQDASGVEVNLIDFDKGAEPNGTRGWAVARFKLWGEEAF